ncbi:SUMO-interacting motif-containing protein 1 isoform X2 [Scyliorhinus canicula]|uniref:SUMO-interacting motif-containing protein 1 isoform X2 n=1 Tax=Scyliorhinus canicula TaxID=7830 RepID=UPI0018F57FA7|nr:SUMO-interacting motif-containing protein 1 isoform X2 [Scyliorhinus canicula]XP_038651536.1 SUMO-interacting motif-containing protein 1 isoform X2 [Scyliorhinus canicula]
MYFRITAFKHQMDNIDLTAEESEVHSQVNSAEEGVGSMQVNSRNGKQGEKSTQATVSSNLSHILLDSDEDLSDSNGVCSFPGLQSDWTMSKDEPDLESPPVLTVEVTTEENLLEPVSNEDPLPELDFIGLNESQDFHVSETKADLLVASNQVSHNSACSVDSTSDTCINSDVESLETFSPDAPIPYSSPSSAGDLLGDYLQSNFEESNNDTVDEPKAGLSTDVEGIPLLIPQNCKQFELDHPIQNSLPGISTPLLEGWEHLQSHNERLENEIKCFPTENQAQEPILPLDQSGNQVLSSETEDPVRANEAKETSPNCSVDKEPLESFQYLIGAPVQHLFIKRPRNEKWHKLANRHSRSSTTRQCKLKEPELISQRQCSMINNTIDENFPQGTLQFLMDFVSPQHYPPHKIVEYIIKKILLGNESSSTILSAYMTLMKIQQLHPANISTVQWDWDLLAYHVENKDPHRKHSLTKSDRLLFLQYVVQTLEDDFQLKHDVPQQTIAKAVLSCDDKFSNVRSVIKWLIDTISKDSEEIQQKNSPLSSSPDSPQVLDSRYPRVVCLLQKMLTLAVEVDRSPTCSSNKIAEAIFQHFLYISERSQRLTVLRSMESQLLRCKLLEFLFHHCTKKQNTLPMSLGKVLHFLKYAKFPSETDEHCSSKWQYWEELVNLLCLLLLSYQEVTKRHLRLSISERVKYVLADTPPVLTTHDEITAEEVQSDMEVFYNRVLSDLGPPLNPQLEEQINLLKALLLCAATGT